MHPCRYAISILVSQCFSAVSATRSQVKHRRCVYQLSKVNSTILLDQNLLPQIYSKAPFAEAATLEVTNLECVRGFSRLFSGLEFVASANTALQLAGANGVGKTSLLRILAGLARSERGTIRWNGGDVDESRLEFNAALNYLGHKIALKESLTPVENISFLGSLGDATPHMSALQSLEIMEVSNLADSPCFQLSAGQKQRIALARVVRSNARLWLLDEPATALDSSGISLLQEIMGKHVKRGGIIIYTSHHPLDLPDGTRRLLKLGQETWN
jgi:heme exporter protein A